MTTDRKKPPKRSDILKYWTLSSGNRILATASGFRNAFGCWPTRILLHRGMADAIKEDILTTLGWQMLASKFDLMPIEKGTVIAEGANSQRHEYGDEGEPDIVAAELWIWGVRLSE